MTKSKSKKKFPVKEFPVSGGKLTRKKAKAAIQAVVSRVEVVNLKEAHEKYLHGESMTHEELEAVYKYYRTLYDTLKQVHQPKYALMLHDVFANVQTIELINQFRSNEK